MNLIYSIIVSVLCIGICLFIISTALKVRRKVFDNFASGIHVDLIFFTVVYRVSLYMLLPAVMRMVSNFQFERDVAVSPSEILYVYLLEGISYVFWFYGIILFSKKYKSKLTYSSYDELLNSQRILGILFCLVLVSMYILKNLSSEFYSDFYLFHIIDIGFVALIQFGSYTIPPFLVSNFKKFGIIPASIGILGTALALSVTQTRGIYVGTTLWFTFLLWQNKSKIQLYIYVLLAIGLIVSFLQYGGFYKINILTEENQITTSGVLLDASNEKLGGKTAIEEIESRFGASTRYATGFIRMRERGAEASIYPIWSSLQGIIPRYFWPDKPEPSSVNGDIHSMGMYLMMNEITGQWWNMCEFPEGLHAYWEFGFLGIVILSIIPAAYVVFVANYFSRFGFLSIPFLLITFKPWGYTSPKLWVSEIIFQIYSIIIPALVLIYTLKFFIKYIPLKYDLLFASKVSLKMRAQVE
ncbi:MAG: hypothetical protein D3914_01085 [Candidatus Electrothrix sp. LOE2]|nr:hypothetical protein [Candidatus Electrothrix sp. LOE2]